MTALPAWLASSLPAVEPHVVIVMRGTAMIAIFPDSHEEVVEDLEALHKLTREQDTEIHQSVYDTYSEGSWMLTYQTGKGNFHTMILDGNTTQKYKSIVHEFENAVAHVQAYKADPSDFCKAYNMIRHHPAFWTRSDSEPTFWWNHQYHHQNVDIDIYTQEDGTFQFGLETGAHVEDSYTTHYHDYRLDVYAPTYEEAMLKLAAKIVIYFNDDGTEVTPAPDEDKPEWVEELEAALAEIKAEDEATS